MATATHFGLRGVSMLGVVPQKLCFDDSSNQKPCKLIAHMLETHFKRQNVVPRPLTEVYCSQHKFRRSRTPSI